MNQVIIKEKNLVASKKEIKKFPGKRGLVGYFKDKIQLPADLEDAFKINLGDCF